jgi:hypothetical protein
MGRKPHSSKIVVGNILVAISDGKTPPVRHSHCWKIILKWAIQFGDIGWTEAIHGEVCYGINMQYVKNYFIFQNRQLFAR